MAAINFILVLFITYFVLTTYAEEGHSHDHVSENLSRETLIEEIAEHLSESSSDLIHHTLTFHHVEKLFQELNFENCTKIESSSSCNLCITAREFMAWKNVSFAKTFTEEEFVELLNGVIYFLTRHGKQQRFSVVCKTFLKEQLSINMNEYNFFKKQYGGDQSILTEESLKKILKDVNITIGEQLNQKEKCFSIDDVIRGAGVSEEKITEHDFEYVSAFIILQLLDKKCINFEHDHDHKETELVEKHYFVEHLFSDYGNKSHMTQDRFEDLLTKLKLGKPIVESGSSDDHDGHDHRRRRSESRRKRSFKEHKECYPAETILSIYSIPESDVITQDKFQEICPALIQQIESESCEDEHDDEPETKKRHKGDWKPWVGAMLSTLIISLGSLSGVFAAPFNRKPYFSYVLMFLICLAVSTLIGDAILHLLPHSLDLHKHDAGGHDHGQGENEFLKPDSFLWKCVLVLFGIYIFFIFEILMHAFSGQHGHSHSLDNMDVLGEAHKHVAPSDHTNAEDVKGTLQLTEDHVHPYSLDYENNGLIQRPSGIHECREGNHGHHSKTSESNSSVSSTDEDEKQLLGKRSVFSTKAFKSVVWMVLVGDAIHNFMDGMAIGVAFTEEWPSGLHGGISTSIAIFCHELPHELGDFAILISSGMTIKQALFMNFISSLTSFVGAILGLSLGTQWNAVPWLFAVTSGLFIYIALVDMLPEMLHNSLLKTRPCLCFTLQNVGLLTGFLLMFFLAAWEEDIKAFIS